MSDPIQLLYVGAQPPDLTTSRWGPWVVHAVPTLDALAEAMQTSAWDAVAIDLGEGVSAQALSQAPALARAVLDAAVLVVTPEPRSADAARLIRLGVQDVLPQRGSADSIARAIWLAVQREQRARELRRAYSLDLATGLPNHAQLREHLSHLVALRDREPAAMALIALKLHGADALESRLGPEAANVVRRKVAVRLRAGLRASDVVASIAGDCFMVLLSWVEDAEDGARVAAKLCASLQRPFQVAGQDVAVGVSPGVARYPTDGREAEALLGLALAAAGMAPGQGRVGSGRQPGSAAANDP